MIGRWEAPPLLQRSAARPCFVNDASAVSSRLPSLALQKIIARHKSSAVRSWMLVQTIAKPYAYACIVVYRKLKFCLERLFRSLLAQAGVKGSETSHMSMTLGLAPVTW